MPDWKIQYSESVEVEDCIMLLLMEEILHHLKSLKS